MRDFYRNTYIKRNETFTLTYRFLPETSVRRSLISFYQVSCHDTVEKWHEINRTCGSACSYRRPGFLPSCCVQCNLQCREFFSELDGIVYKSHSWADITIGKALKALFQFCSGTWNSLPSDVRSCHTVDTYKRQYDTSRPICSDSLNLMPPAILYLRTLWCYTNAVIIIFYPRV